MAFIVFSVFVIFIMLVLDRSLMLLEEVKFLELAWTLLPTFAVLMVGMPSMTILFNTSQDLACKDLTLKVVGHQWYWELGFSDFPQASLDSYIKQVDDLAMGESRLLEVDNKLTVPFNLNLEVLVSSSDVIHSWAIPAMGVKVDANPGFINSVGMGFQTPGLYFGQCSEICGVNHSFMPTVVESTSSHLFKLKVPMLQ